MTAHAWTPTHPPDAAREAPPLPHTYVPRSCLWERLDGADDGAVTLLVAPTGAGKTLGVSGWIRVHRARQPGGVLWVQAHDDLYADRLDALLESASRFGGARPLLVVIDDAHRLPPDAVALIDHELSHDPARLHLLLVSRWDLPLSRLTPELLGHFTMLRGELLRMDDEESAALIRAHAHTAAPGVVAAVAERAQGWCAALVLTARAVGSGGDSAALRIVDEVFAGLTDQQQHLLLCLVADEIVTTDLAAHLTRDPRAPDALAALEATGMLVSRVAGTEPTRWRIHPLLAEVARLRLLGGGPDVDRARAAIGRAVRLDLARGHGEEAFARQVVVGNVDDAARLLATEGVAMVMRGEGAQVAEFVDRHPDVVARTPGAWFAVATERWVNNDVATALHWIDLLLQSPDLGGSASGVQLACLRLMRARLGLEPIADAVAHASRLVPETPRQPAAQAILPQLLLELAITQNWTGQLDEAEVHLSALIALCHSRRLPALEVAAMSHLAMTEFMQGRERACVEVATEAIARLGEPHPWHKRFSSPRAGLALLLGGFSEPPWPAYPIEAPDPWDAPTHDADLCTTFWLAIRESHLAIHRGAVAEAEAVLDRPLAIPEELPTHLRLTWLLHRALLASLAADAARLQVVADELRGLGAVGEAALVDGLRADLLGDRAGARRLFARAAARATCPQPPAAVFAMVAEAQLADALGDAAAARDQLREAVVATEVRRNGVPFLGWSREGTSIRTLLAELATTDASPWLTLLVASTDGSPDVVHYFARHRTARRPRRRTGLPALSRRENEVLHELARGSTYADIAATLVIAESTVKTHVSSLYGKLGASRRSEALAVARSVRLV